MKGSIKIWIVLLIFFTITAGVAKDIPEGWGSTIPEGWGLTTVEITDVEPQEDCYTYTYRYTCPESTVEDRGGKKITVPIELRTFCKNKPKKGQRLKGIYNKKEPSELQLLEEVVYEE